MRRRLDVIANVTLILACALLIAQVAFRWSHAPPADQAHRTARPLEVYGVGDTFPPLEGIDMTAGARTVVLIVRSSCGYCTNSMPFYRRLREGLNTYEGRIKLVVVSPDAKGDTSAYFARHDVNVDAIVSSPLDRLKVHGTPTLLLIDGHSRVTAVWTGQLSTDKEEEVFASLTGQTASSSAGLRP